EEQPPVSLTQSLGFGAGTFLTMGAIDLLAHLGPTGLVIGGIAAYVAAQHGPELVEQVREALPSPASLVSRQPRRTPRRQRGARERGRRSVLDRALGRFPEEEDEAAEQEQEEDIRFEHEETVIVDEFEETP